MSSKATQDLILASQANHGKRQNPVRNERHVLLMLKLAFQTSFIRGFEVSPLRSYYHRRLQHKLVHQFARPLEPSWVVMLVALFIKVCGRPYESDFLLEKGMAIAERSSL